jgi:hypothetical protein
MVSKQIVTKYQSCANWAKGANGGKGTIPAEFTDNFQV